MDVINFFLHFCPDTICSVIIGEEELTNLSKNLLETKMKEYFMETLNFENVIIFNELNEWMRVRKNIISLTNMTFDSLPQIPENYYIEIFNCKINNLSWDHNVTLHRTNINTPISSQPIRLHQDNSIYISCSDIENLKSKNIISI